MVHRIPLIVNASASQIQELPTSDTLAGGVPLGAILMWGGGNTIPTGFTLCNAANAGTVNGITVPNLEDKFIIGAKQHSSGWKTNVTGSLGASGGEATKTLGTANLPSHTHTDGTLATDTKSLTGTIRKISEGFNANGTASGVFTKTNDGTNNITGSSSTSPVSGVDFDGSHNHDITGNTGDQGGTMGQAFENLPPYFALAYIMRTT